MTEKELVELEDIVKRSAQPKATHQHWFPNVYADAMCREIRRLRAENKKLKEQATEVAD